MKRKILITALLAAAACLANAQISPENCSVAHSDSCWYFTLGYDNPKPKRDEGMLVVTHICTPDTCISTATRHIQGRRYANRYVKRYDNRPKLQRHGPSSHVLAVPENFISDTVYAITYCEHEDKNGTEYSCDTVAICMPQCPPLSNHRVTAAMSIADHLALEHPHVKNIAHYTPLDAQSGQDATVTPTIVRYTTNSSRLDPEYLQNAQSIEDFMDIINAVLADSTTTLEGVQIIGYTSPDGRESNSTGLGLARAGNMRDHIRKHHHLPDSLFEIADGGKSWRMVYDDIISMKIDGGDSLVAALQREKSVQRREAMLKKFDNGNLYRELTEKAFPAHRMACCTGIYYRNRPDSVAAAINNIVDELVNNPSPDYRKLIDELKLYRNDPRILNLQGVIEYRRHHRHAAKQAFAKAAAMGDEQAAINLKIIENDNKKENRYVY